MPGPPPAGHDPYGSDVLNSEQESSFEVYREGGMKASIRLLITMVFLVRKFRNTIDEKLREIGHSASRMETLGAIINMPGPKSQSDVAKRLRVENATITRMVDALSKEGLVTREPDPNDRRVNLLSVSTAGEDAMREIFIVYDAVRAHILQNLPEEEYARLQAIFDDMLRLLDEPIDPDLYRSGLQTTDGARK